MFLGHSVCAAFLLKLWSVNRVQTWTVTVVYVWQNDCEKFHSRRLTVWRARCAVLSCWRMKNSPKISSVTVIIRTNACWIIEASHVNIVTNTAAKSISSIKPLTDWHKAAFRKVICRSRLSLSPPVVADVGGMTVITSSTAQITQTALIDSRFIV